MMVKNGDENPLGSNPKKKQQKTNPKKTIKYSNIHL